LLPLSSQTHDELTAKEGKLPGERESIPFELLRCGRHQVQSALPPPRPLLLLRNPVLVRKPSVLRKPVLLPNVLVNLDQWSSWGGLWPEGNAAKPNELPMASKPREEPICD